MNLLTLFLFSWMSQCLASQVYRILAFLPLPTKSHQNTFSPILYELARRGHHVVFVTPEKPKISHQNLEIRLLKPYLTIFNKKYDFINMGSKSVPGITYHRYSVGIDMAEHFYGDPVSQELIHGSEYFDAVIMESYCFQEPVSAFIHKFGCPAIEVSSLGDLAWVNELSGLPDNTAYQMDVKSPLSDQMSFIERIYNTYSTWSTVLISYYSLQRMQKVMDTYFNYTGWESRASIYEIVSNRSIILVNRDVSVATYPFPVAPHVKNIGGLNIVPKQPLPQDIQIFMDEAHNGVIYFSLGSNLKTSDFFKEEYGDAFLKVFKTIPQKILIKWESEEKLNLADNIKVSKWFPQQDILAHKNCKVFITHGGLLGITEAVHTGVPLLGIPFFWDQFKNLKQVETAGYGLKLDIANVSKASVSWALDQLLHNPRYKNEAVKRSEMMRDKRNSPLDEAVYWIEHSIKYPNALTPSSTKLKFYQLHLIDIQVFAIFCLWIMYNLVSSTFKLLKSFSFSKKRKKLL